ncbi:MAG: TatD family hydrolase, partial [bacterium]
MLVDTHAHLNFHDYDQDREAVFKRALDNDIWLINVGANLSSSQQAVGYLQDYPIGVYAAVGLHPEHLVDQIFEAEGKQTKIKKEILKIAAYKELTNASPKVVAIGEIGLDYYRLPENKKKQAKIKENQQAVFNELLALAGDLGLPVILHCREAHQDMLEILRNYNLTGVAHSFAGREENLREYLKLGYYIGYNGIITFKKKAENIKRLVAATPLDKIVLET